MTFKQFIRNKIIEELKSDWFKRELFTMCRTSFTVPKEQPKTKNDLYFDEVRSSLLAAIDNIHNQHPSDSYEQTVFHFKQDAKKLWEEMQ